MEISVIVPTINEEASIKSSLDALSRLVNVSEIIVVDGGSGDRTVEVVRNYEKVKQLEIVELGKANRGAQLNTGAEAANGDILWFVHADARPKQGSGKQIKKYLNYTEVVGGNFEVLFSGSSRWAKFITWLYPHLRSIGLAYGDSAFFVRREVFEEIGGFKNYPLFEDVNFYKRVKKRGRFVHIKMPVTVSSRRFENRFFLWVFMTWCLRQGLYWLGVPPRLLGKTYGQIR